jgi:histone H3/H4
MSTITFSSIQRELNNVQPDTDSDIESDIESTDVSSIEMTDTETEKEPELMDEDSDDDDDKAINEIRYYQSTTHNLIPFPNFENLVREIMQDFNKDLDIDEEAIKALQAATESYIIELFKKTQMNAIMNDRQTILVKDMSLARYHQD